MCLGQPRFIALLRPSGRPPGAFLAELQPLGRLGRPGGRFGRVNEAPGAFGASPCWRQRPPSAFPVPRHEPQFIGSWVSPTLEGAQGNDRQRVDQVVLNKFERQLAPREGADSFDGGIIQAPPQ